MIIPNKFMNAIVAIGVPKDGNDKHWIGTGFIVARKDESNPEISDYFIVTNKHVVENCEKIFVRFNALEGDFVKDYDIVLTDGKNCFYSKHPNDAADVIALQIAPEALINDKSVWGAIDLTNEALSLEEMKAYGVAEGNLVYSLGFPMNLVDIIKSPICRLGCISRIFDAFIRRKESPTFLVDAQTFPGNSGGPIIGQLENMSMKDFFKKEVKLIGILSAYIPYTTPLINAQTHRPSMILEENSGLTIVHPVDRIREVVDMEYHRIKNLTLPKNKSIPLIANEFDSKANEAQNDSRD